MKFQGLVRRLFGAKVITPEEIEGVLKLPVLAVIPHLERRRSLAQSAGLIRRRLDLNGRWRSRLLINFPDHSPAAIAYDNLIHEIRPVVQKDRRKVILVVSAVAGEGGSLTCANLAIAAGRQGLKTLIIEGHMRAPRISGVFHVDLEPGLTGCLNRSLSASSCIQKFVLPFTDLLAAGRSVSYPAALWNSAAFQQLLDVVRTFYDLVLIEASPLLLFPDTAELAKKVDTILLVHQFGRSSSDRLGKAVEKIQDVKDRILGVVLNDSPS
jgi:receptor protein-tyrosine kinase